MDDYVPSEGEIIWLNFTPQSGHEQAGHRPAVVLSPAAYNRIGLLLCCPTTTKAKGYPFEVAISGKRSSVVLADQIKSVDWKSREAKLKGRVSDNELSEIRAKVRALVGS
ncbi:endoribonuclease MazF [Acetobacter sp. UBA5411]|uniref:endoribonuclease MazF n=1 Tax=Acetobacter sp. UBA5411 TaxID=1945905 RepID=UPI0025C4C452|nr:endoribonuclease MazF [Acetobacter sp. UBA5411]